MVASKRKIVAVITLFFVAPLVAEYLLGDLPLKMLAALIFLAPAYGGAAVLIRESARRMGRGWPTMLVLGAAYALIGEGLLSQSLFNPDYMNKHLHLLAPAFISAWGMGAWWTLLMLNLHTFWSMGVSIALVEALFPAEAEVPWLGLAGDSAAALLFALGAAANFGIGFKQNHFAASKGQLLGAAAVSILLVASAFLIPAPRSQRSLGKGPSLWLTGAIAFVLGIAVLRTPPKWGWGAVGAMLVIDAAFLVVVAFLSRRSGWSALHVLSLAAGGALVYGVRAFTARPLFGGLVWMRISNAVFLAAALGLIWLDVRRIVGYERPT